VSDVRLWIDFILILWNDQQKFMMLLLFTLHYTNHDDDSLIERREMSEDSCFFATLAVLIDNFLYVDMSLALYDSFFEIEKKSTVHYIAYLIFVYSTFSLSLNI